MEEGQTHDCGSVEVTVDEMLEFAGRYDPRPIHVDEAAARESMAGDLIDSGWLTCALSARLLVVGSTNDNATLGGRGMDEIRWYQPVYAGDTLSVSVELVEERPDEDPAFGHTRAAVTTTNQDGDTVLTVDGLGLVEKREGP